MASGAKRKTTMAKIMRENKVREKAMLKRARKDQRKYEAANPVAEAEVTTDDATPTDDDDATATDDAATPQPAATK